MFGHHSESHNSGFRMTGAGTQPSRQIDVHVPGVSPPGITGSEDAHFPSLGSGKSGTRVGVKFHTTLFTRRGGTESENLDSIHGGKSQKELYTPTH